MSDYHVTVVVHLNVQNVALSPEHAQNQVHTILDEAKFFYAGNRSPKKFHIEDVEVTGVYDEDHNELIVT